MDCLWDGIVSQFMIGPHPVLHLKSLHEMMKNDFGLYQLCCLSSYEMALASCHAAQEEAHPQGNPLNMGLRVRT